MEFLKKIGIRTLADLRDKKKLIQLGALLRDIFNKVLLYDNSIDLEQINVRDALILANGRNNQYWEDLKEKQPDNYYKKRKEFVRLVKKYSGRDINKNYGEMLTMQWNKMLYPEKFQKLTAIRNQLEEQLKINEIPEINTLHIELIPVIDEISNFYNSFWPKLRICKYCGADISHQRKNSFFCSIKCKNDYTNPRLNPANNLKRRLRKTNNPTLFDIEPFIQLSLQQKKLINNRNTIYN